MEPKAIINGVCQSDFPLAEEVIEQRYHRNTYEELVIAEVFEKREKRLARKLHNEWEAEMAEFVELMECS